MTPLRLFTACAALVAAGPALADCATNARYSFAYASRPAATLAYGSTYSYTATNPAGASRAFSVAIAQNGLSSTVINGAQMPAISTLVTGADATRRNLVLGGAFSGRTANIASGTRTMTVTFTFAQPIRDFSMTVHDVDFAANQYRDMLMITGAINAATYTPVMNSPWGNGNGASTPRTAANSSVTFGASNTPVTITTQQAVGSGAANNNSDTGTITATFAQPVTSVTMRYGNAPYTSGENTTGQQGLGISDISFCPMPEIGMTKSSAPTDPGGHNLPGSDVTYTLTVTNSGSSPVDVGTIVLTDLLPPGVRFKNVVLDPELDLPVAATPGVSGLNIVATSVSYSNDGATWNYVPAPGYDDNVRGIRIQATGAMNANSTFSVRFIAQVK